METNISHIVEKAILLAGKENDDADSMTRGWGSRDLGSIPRFQTQAQFLDFLYKLGQAI